MSLPFAMIFLAGFGHMMPEGNLAGIVAGQDSDPLIIQVQSTGPGSGCGCGGPGDPGGDPDDPDGPDGPDDPDGPDEPTDPGDGGTLSFSRFGGGERDATTTPATATSGGSGPSVVAMTVPAPSGAPEIMLAGSGEQIARAATVIDAMGGKVLRRKSLGQLGIGTLVIDSGSGFGISRLTRALRDNRVDVSAAYNTVYKQAAGPRLYAGTMVGLDDLGTCRLASSVRIGMIDGPIDTNLPSLRGTAIVSRSFLPLDKQPGHTGHGTAFANLVAASGADGNGGGLAIGARIYSASVFATANKSDLAQADVIAEAVDWLLQQRVDVIGLPFSGPTNDVFAMVLKLADARGVVLVAPVGNDGQSYVRFPASDPHVLAVTAVDAKKRIYSRANRGNRVDFAAPGVDLYLPGPDGYSYRSGTSFATGVMVALAAREVADGHKGRTAISGAIAARAEDLGSAGTDTVFGRGLAMATACTQR